MIFLDKILITSGTSPSVGTQHFLIFELCFFSHCIHRKAMLIWVIVLFGVDLFDRYLGYLAGYQIAETLTRFSELDMNLGGDRITKSQKRPPPHRARHGGSRSPEKAQKITCMAAAGVE